jgi:hypothetical protein
LITVSEAAKRCFLEIKPTARSNGKVMRLDTARASTEIHHAWHSSSLRSHYAPLVGSGAGRR